MRAAFYRSTGAAREVIEVGTLDLPRPGPGEVLVKLRASGINPADTKRRAGWLGGAMSHPLVVPHSDGAGDIVEVGEGVAGSRVGERVWIHGAQGGYGEAGRAFGTAAEWIALPSDLAPPLPGAFSYAEGACLGVPARTAHRAVFADGSVRGMTVLVTGAAGAVGHFAVQFATLDGARVLATASASERLDHAREAGADAVIDRMLEDVGERVLALTHGEGVDRIVEVDFGANIETCAALIRRNGTIAAFSSSAVPRPVLPYYDFAFKGANLRFIQGGALSASADSAAEVAIETHADSLRVAVGAEFPLADTAEAHERVESGKVLGNVVVLPGE